MSKFTTAQWVDLCKSVKKDVPQQLGPNAWTLLMASALTISPSPELLAEFFTHLTKNEANFISDEAVQGLSFRFRDVLLKHVTISGAPQVLMAMTPLAAAEGSPQEKAPASQLSEKWKKFDNAAIHARGTSTIHSIYGQKLLHEKIFPMWGLHTQDVQFMELFTVYGLYLSDYEHMTPIEAELVVFTGIICQGLGTGPSLWHLRGLGRLLGARGVEAGDGVSEEQVKKIARVKDQLRGVKTSIMAVVEFVGSEFERKAKIEAWPNVGDVQRALGGWGEDA